MDILHKVSQTWFWTNTYKAVTDKNTARKHYCNSFKSVDVLVGQSPLSHDGNHLNQICVDILWIHEQVPESLAASCVLATKKSDITVIFKKELSDTKYQADMSHWISVSFIAHLNGAKSFWKVHCYSIQALLVHTSCISISASPL